MRERARCSRVSARIRRVEPGSQVRNERIQLQIVPLYGDPSARSRLRIWFPRVCIDVIVRSFPRLPQRERRRGPFDCAVGSRKNRRSIIAARARLCHLAITIPQGRPSRRSLMMSRPHYRSRTRAKMISEKIPHAWRRTIASELRLRGASRITIHMKGV